MVAQRGGRPLWAAQGVSWAGPPPTAQPGFFCRGLSERVCLSPGSACAKQPLRDVFAMQVRPIYVYVIYYLYIVVYLAYSWLEATDVSPGGRQDGPDG